MMKVIVSIVFSLVLILLLGACGPSPEESATQTAAAWTATPPPPTETPTPTPVPYDLTVSVVDSEGNAIGGAYIVFPESGDEAPVQADENGMFSWTNLASEGANLEISGQGYTTQSGPLTLTRGLNEATFTMERDPFQLLPSEVCLPGQEVLYIEDFEDGIVDELGGFGRPFWELVEDPEIGTYLVGGENEDPERWLNLNVDYKNIVFHLDIVRSTDVDMIWIYLRQSSEGGYIGVFSRDGHTWLQKDTEGAPAWPFRFIDQPDGLTWEHVSLSAYEASFDLWLNDELLLGVEDANPLGSGAMAIAMSPHTEPVAIDNLVVCGLSEPYEPPVAEEDGT